jgi:hypothetical protein
MDLSMVTSAQRHRKLVAHLPAQRAALRKAQVMGVRGPATTNQTGLLGHVSNVLTVTNPTQLRQRQHTLVDYIGSSCLFASIRPALRLRALRFLQHLGSVGRKDR